MNILVIHGDHTAKGYQRLREVIDGAKKKGWRIERFSDGEFLTLAEKLSASSLFDKKILHVVDNPRRIKRADFKWLNKGEKDQINLVIYSQSLIPSNLLNSLPKGYKIEEYKLPKLIWKFLDSFYPQNVNECLRVLHEVVKIEPEEFVFHLLARHLRDLYWVSIDPNGPAYQPWRIGKLKGQAKRFEKGQLKTLISRLADIDVKVKTSKAQLLSSLDFLIATHLE